MGNNIVPDDNEIIKKNAIIAVESVDNIWMWCDCRRSTACFFMLIHDRSLHGAVINYFKRTEMRVDHPQL